MKSKQKTRSKYVVRGNSELKANENEVNLIRAMLTWRHARVKLAGLLTFDDIRKVLQQQKCYN